MSFNQIVWKMAKVNYKKYIFYLLCNIFAVMFLFMFSTIFFNEAFIQVLKDPQQTLPIIGLIVFSVFFITYAHNIFIKNRRSEFGLFITLGMSNRDIAKLLLLENGVIALVSILCGILGGTVFSKLFFLILINSVGLPNVPFRLNSDMFTYAILSFLFIFTLAIATSLYHILKGNVIDNLKSEKVADTIIKSPSLGVVGLVMLIGSIAGNYFSTTVYYEDAYMPLWLTLTLLGLYFSLSQITSFLIDVFKKNKGFYYPRLLFLTNLDYKFKQLTSILMLVTTMIMITIFYCTISIIVNKFGEREIVERNPYDIAFYQTENEDNLSVEEINSMIDKKENPLQEHNIIPFYKLTQKHPYMESAAVYTFMPVDHFNRLTNNDIKLQDKEFVYYINRNPEPGTTDRNDFEYGLSLELGNENISYKYKEKIVKQHINQFDFDNDTIFLVSNSEFQELKKNPGGFEGTIHLINVANWKESGDTVDKLKKSLKTEERAYPFYFKIELNNINKMVNGMPLFVTIFASVVFFLGSCILLYLNLFSRIDEEKAKYTKLHHIGITAENVKQIISREITTLFFVPTIVGSTIAFLYIIGAAQDDGNGGVLKNPEILLYFFIVTGIYLVIQLGFFIYARRKMYFQLAK